MKYKTLYWIGAIGTLLSFSFMFWNFIIFTPLVFIFFGVLCYWYLQVNEDKE